jgi:hypothetical protein
MGEPSVIAVQDADADHGHGHGAHAHHHEPHIAFLAFRKADVQVDDPAGFQDVLPTGEYSYVALDGKELVIEGNLPGVPSVDPSYGNVVRKDDYWPEARDDWNRDYVPARGGRPKKSAVKAYLRFGAGLISADRISAVEWEFPMLNGGVHRGHFAEEVIYSGFSHSPETVEITLVDLPDGRGDGDERRAASRTLRFSQRPGATARRLTLFVGNLMARDMEVAVRRQVTTRLSTTTGDHFKYLNRVAARRQGDGPLPVGKNPPDDGAALGGGQSGGICGPGTGNGG